MKTRHLFTRLLSMALVCVMLLSFLPATVFAANDAKTNGKISWEKTDEIYKQDLSGRLAKEEDLSEYKDADVVRVSIILEKASTLAKGFKAENIAKNASAMSYRSSLKSVQASMEKTISEKALDGQKLDVVWNLTLAANIISANVPFGKIDAIKAIAGIKDVVLERQYAPAVAEIGGDDPSMATSGKMIGSYTAWAEGYTGAGSRIAIVDTGIDTDHQSLDASAYEYALEQNAEELGMSVEDYKASLDLLDKEEIASVWSELNFPTRCNTTSDQLYINSKIPFGANYVDKGLDITHDNDVQGEHGSHVTGITTANRFVKKNGSFAYALDTVGMQGVAPDAQVFGMKVFGKGGGAYDSDYMVAIEDAIILNADSINLSLGSGNPGLSKVDDAYAEIFDNVTKSGTVLVMSAGNSGYWAENSSYGYLYSDGASFDTAGSPGSYTETLGVASVDNDGSTGTYFKVADELYFYSETNGYANKPMASIAGTYDYIYFDNTLADADGNSLIDAYASEIQGKVVFGFRGTSSFYQKGNAAAKNGAVATIICNNQAGVINMDLTGYTYPAPCVSILQSDAFAIKAASTPVKDESGKVLYYTGKIDISNDVASGNYNSEYYTMSSFSSWGIPGSLEMKPEITAPGGSIYSLFGSSINSDTGLAQGGSDKYELMSGTSMAAPQVAGMAAVLGQYVRENGLEEKTGYSARQIINSLLMATAEPLLDANVDYYYSVLNQGAGLANVAAAIDADTLLMMGADATDSYKDGKIKVELGDDPAREGKYEFSFKVTNMADVAKSYSFDADFFTQDLFADSGMVFMDTWTAPLDADVKFVCQGAGSSLDYDFNDDGFVDEADADTILAYVVGEIDSFAHMENANFDSDPAITSRDAYLFLIAEKNLEETDLIVEPGETKTVKVKVTLKDVDDYDDCGTYVEGYVFVNELENEDIVAQTYSIPVIGYYGSWTDASMFDVGSYTQYAYGLEDRAPYLYGAVGNNALYANAALVNYAGDTANYYFGGNPVFDDGVYQPERNAITSADKIAKLNYALIRNANVMLTVYDDEGNTYYSSNPSQTYAAYYYTNGQRWQNTSRSASLGYSPKNVPEGTQLYASVVAAPEYYEKADGSIAWNELSDGAYLTIPFTVDNSAPEIVGNVECKDGNMFISVKDNQYIAGIFVYDEKGNEIASGGPNNKANAGETMNASIAIGDNTLLAVEIYDYAMNCTTYKVNLAGGGDVVDGVSIDPTEVTILKNNTVKLNAYVTPFGVADDAIIWTSADASIASVDNKGLVTGVSNGTTVITAAAHADPTKTAECVVTVEAIELYVEGILQDENGAPIFFDWDLANDATWKRGNALPGYISAFAWDEANDDSYGYFQDEAGLMYKVDLASGEVLATSEATTGFGAPMQDMAIAYYTSVATGSDCIFACYDNYILISDDAMANDFTMGIQLGQLYDTNASITAIAWVGLDKYQGNYADLFYALGNDNLLYLIGYVPATGSILSASEGAPIDGFKGTWPGYDGHPYSSLVWSLDTRNYYLSYFNGETNQIYEIVESEESIDAALLGDVGQDVWPASVYGVYSTADAGNRDLFANRTVNFVNVSELAPVTLETNAAIGSLNAVKVASTAPSVVKKGEVNEVIVNEDDEDMGGNIYVSVAPFNENLEDMNSNNGWFGINYNPEVLEFVEVLYETEHLEANDTITNGLGEVQVAYADVKGIEAGDIAFTVVFKPLKDGETNVKIDAKEVDDNDIERSVIVTVNSGEAELVRLEGSNRTKTAAAIAAAAYTEAETVVIANGDDYADALAAAPLAYAMDAPILLVRSNKAVDAATLDEMALLGAEKVVIIGGESAIGQAVIDQLNGEGYTDIERIAGANRFETAVKIAEKLEEVAGAASEAFVVSGETYADALAVSAVAALKNAPILYAKPNGKLRATEAYLADSDINDVYVIGGEAAIAAAGIDNIKACGVETVERIAGDNRYMTCIAIDEEFDDVFTGNEICVATGHDFPDALAGGVYAACKASPMILVDKHVKDYQADYITGRDVQKVVVFGGENAVSEELANAIYDVVVGTEE